jgi:hypothetical protein
MNKSNYNLYNPTATYIADICQLISRMLMLVLDVMSKLCCFILGEGGATTCNNVFFPFFSLFKNVFFIFLFIFLLFIIVEQFAMFTFCPSYFSHIVNQHTFWGIGCHNVIHIYCTYSYNTFLVWFQVNDLKPISTIMQFIYMLYCLIIAMYICFVSLYD